MGEVRGLARMSDDAIAATAAALAARLPPEGWRVATDVEGRDYLYNNQGEVRWATTTSNVPNSDDAPQQMLQRALDGDFGQLLANKKAPFFDGFFQDAQSCPAVSKE